MVSPMKNKNKGKEVRTKLKFNQTCSKEKLHKLLDGKRFFINIKNHAIQTKYENKLKSFGAITVPFLDKDVNAVITDTSGYNGKRTESLIAAVQTPSPLCYSVSPATPSSLNDIHLRKSTTRAEAMLEKVSVKPCMLSANNPDSDALAWNIPVYSVDFFEKWLSVKISQYTGNKKKEPKGLRIFSHHFLKLEHSKSGQYRPEFREVTRRPCVNVNTPIGCSPFYKSSNKKKGNAEPEEKDIDRMNKACNKAGNGGYCEICGIHYADLSQHVVTSSHVRFVCEDKHYSALDNCIKTRSVEAFLASHAVGVNNESKDGNTSTRSNRKETDATPEMGQNVRRSYSLHVASDHPATRSFTNTKLLTDESLKEALQVQCNGFTNHSKRNHGKSGDGSAMKSPENSNFISLGNRIISVSCPTTPCSEESPSKFDNDMIGHHLRPRKHINSITATQEEVVDSSSPKIIKKEPSTSNCVVNGLIEKQGEDEGKKKLGKRLSAEEKLLEDNKAYYKVEVLRTKLRSTVYYCAQEQENKPKINVGEKRIKSEPEDEEEEAEEDDNIEENVSLSNRLKKLKKRKSQLSILSIEAENFMFGTTKKEPEGESRVEKMEVDEQKPSPTISESKSTDSEGVKTKKRRRTQAEAFIEDNLDYYKFEISESRLRHHDGDKSSNSKDYAGMVNKRSRKDSPCSSSLLMIKEKPEKTPVKKALNFSPYKEPKEKAKENVVVKKEKVEKTKEQDEKNTKENTEKEHVENPLNSFSCFKDTTASPCCVPSATTTSHTITYSFESVPQEELWYQTFKRQDEFNETYFPHYHEYPTMRIPREKVIITEKSPQINRTKNIIPNTKVTRLSALVAEDKPRKSPRCHASTLAIMSSLTGHRRRSRLAKIKSPQSLQKPKVKERPPPPPPLILPKKKEVKKEDCSAIMKEVNNFFVKKFSTAKDDKHLNDLMADVSITDQAGGSRSPRGKVKTKSPKCSQVGEGELCMDLDPMILHDEETMKSYVQICKECKPNMEEILEEWIDENITEDSNMENFIVQYPDDLEELNDDANDFLGFTDEDKLPFKKRFKKRRNLTGWPHDRKRKKIVRINDSQVPSPAMSMGEEDEEDECDEDDDEGENNEDLDEEEEEEEEEEDDDEGEDEDESSDEENTEKDTENSCDDDAWRYQLPGPSSRLTHSEINTRVSYNDYDSLDESSDEEAQKNLSGMKTSKLPPDVADKYSGKYALRMSHNPRKSTRTKKSRWPSKTVR